MIQVNAIPAFSDNYIWCLTKSDGDAAVIVDPGDGGPVLSYLQAHQLQLAAILITHKHADHIGGVKALTTAFPNVPVYGPANEPIQLLTQRLNGGDRVRLAAIEAEFEVLDVPGHTEGHIAYYGHGSLFCGDTLFAGGCGRVFSGTHEQLHDSLMQIAALPEETLVYCAHEYTLDNLGFAAWVEPDSEALATRLRDDKALRQAGKATVPSRLSLEKLTNPFLRTGEPAVVTAAEQYAGEALKTGAAVFRAVRTWKDREYD